MKECRRKVLVAESDDDDADSEGEGLHGGLVWREFKEVKGRGDFRMFGAGANGFKKGEVFGCIGCKVGGGWRLLWWLNLMM